MATKTKSGSKSKAKATKATKARSTRSRSKAKGPAQAKSSQTKRPLPAAAPSQSRRRRAPKKIEQTVTQHPFPPGTEVTLHHELDVSIERIANREPAGPGIGKATVTKQGTLKVRVPHPGTYAVAAKSVRPENPDGFDYVQVTVSE